MRRFGSDKPDLRFGVELVECTEYFADTPFRVFQAPYVGAVVMPGGASQPRRTLDGWQEFAKQRGHKGLAYVLVGEDGTLGGPVAKNLTDAERDGLAAHVGAAPGDCIFFAAGSGEVGPRAARRDAHRDRQASRPDRPRRRGRSSGSSTGRCSSPPTRRPPPATWRSVRARGPRCTTRSPRPSRSRRRRSTPIRAPRWPNAYDIVCNGNEIGGGSIRIHNRDIQERVFAMMGIGHDEAQEKFGFLLDAFAFGAPPHGGIAFGWDRITALLGGIRLDPRGDRVPEVRRRRRPADRRARADHGAAAQGIRNRCEAAEAGQEMSDIPDADCDEGVQQEHRRRVPRQRRQGGWPVRGRQPAAAHHDRRQVGPAAAGAAGLLHGRRQDDHHRLEGGRRHQPRLGAQSAGQPAARTSRSAPTPTTSPAASCRPPNATRSSTRSSRRHRVSANTSRRRRGSSRCSSSCGFSRSGETP